MFRIATTYLRSLAFEVGELRHFSHVPKQGDTAGRNCAVGSRDDKHNYVSLKQPHGTTGPVQRVSVRAV